MRAPSIFARLHVLYSSDGIVVWIPAGKAQAVPGYCAAPNKIDWPAAIRCGPLCWMAPSAATGRWLRAGTCGTFFIRGSAYSGKPAHRWLT